MLTKVFFGRSPGPGGPQQITWLKLQQEGLPQGTKAVVNVTGHNILDKFKRFNDSFKTLVRNTSSTTYVHHQNTVHK